MKADIVGDLRYATTILADYVGMFRPKWCQHVSILNYIVY